MGGSRQLQMAFLNLENFPINKLQTGSVYPLSGFQVCPFQALIVSFFSHFTELEFSRQSVRSSRDMSAMILLLPLPLLPPLPPLPVMVMTMICYSLSMFELNKAISHVSSLFWPSLWLEAICGLPSASGRWWWLLLNE